MKCMVCTEECEGNLTIIDPNLFKPMKCCEKCFEIWTNNDYAGLTKRVKK